LPDPFLTTYLKEIGVHTPVSIVRSEKEPTIASEFIPESNLSEPGSLNALSVKAADCRLCGLAETRNKVVFGVGNSHADLVFIGEAPGRDEDITGEPFVGRAGKLLDRMLSGIGLDREQIYIMNTIKCRPPNNRDPRAEEVEACNLWFEQQLDMLAPKVICLLGRVAAQTVLQTDATLGSLRGRWHDYNGIPVWVTYHPAYLLRSPQQKKHSWQDLLTLSGRLQ
jgi:DNA polymerase